jgi:AcrR family transcriptional regulator
MDTKEKILDAAEELFAEHGFAATSMRAITTAADVNLAAVNYHFGSKEGLFIAVLRRRFDVINAERLRMLDTAVRKAGDRPIEVEEILRALFDPAFRTVRALGESGRRFMRLAGRMHTETQPHLMEEFLSLFRELVPPFQDALQRALPDLDLVEMHRRIQFAIGSMAYALMWGDDLQLMPGMPDRTMDPDEIPEQLVLFCAAGMRAPQPHRTAASTKEANR